MTYTKYFRIEKGNHYSNNRFPFLFFRKKLNFYFIFEDSPIYKLNNNSAQKDTNKIFGISDSFHHQRNSVRIGWRYNKITDEIELLIYYYINKVHNTFVIETLPNLNRTLKKPQNCSIEITKNRYNITVNRKQFSIPRETWWFNCRYLLFPYFGGKAIAPKRFDIKIKWGWKDTN